MSLPRDPRARRRRQTDRRGRWRRSSRCEPIIGSSERDRFPPTRTSCSMASPAASWRSSPGSTRSRAREVCIDVCRSPDASEYTSIRFLQDGYMQRGSFREPRYEHAFVLDPTPVLTAAGRASPVPRKSPPPTWRRATFLKCGSSWIGALWRSSANGEQCLAVRVYPQREDSIGVSIRAQGRDALLKSSERGGSRAYGDPF